MVSRTIKHDDELLSCFDEKGHPIRPQSRKVVHKEPLSVWHGVANIWVLNRVGEILCTQRSQSVSGNPGKWQTYLGGHVQAKSTFAETAGRELTEEIGITIQKADLQLLERGQREDTHHIYENFVVKIDVDPSALKFTDEEIYSARWLSFQKYQESKTYSPKTWCNSINIDQYHRALEILGISTKTTNKNK